MIPSPPGPRVWLAVGQTDMRRGMNGLALKALRRDPHAGDLDVFRAGSGLLIKIAWHDGLHVALCQAAGACTNIIENMNGTVRRVCRNLKHWRDAAMALRWAGAAMLEAAKKFSSSQGPWPIADHQGRTGRSWRQACHQARSRTAECRSITSIPAERDLAASREIGTSPLP